MKSSASDSYFSGSAERSRNPRLGLVSVFSGILTVTDLNIFNGPAQTTKLGQELE
jgi:hypothetical protein